MLAYNIGLKIVESPYIQPDRTEITFLRIPRHANIYKQERIRDKIMRKVRRQSKPGYGEGYYLADGTLVVHPETYKKMLQTKWWENDRE